LGKSFSSNRAIFIFFCKSKEYCSFLALYKW
jgi:hypothetical protein